MKQLKQTNCSLPSVARKAIALLFFILLIFCNESNAQQYDTLTCPQINDTCNFGGANTLVAGGRQIKCMNEQVILTGRYSPTINGTVIDWIDISNCLGNSDTAHFVSQTFITSPDTALRAVLTFSAPGVYMFLLRAHCNTDPIGFIEGIPQYAVLEDTVRIIIKPIPIADAGSNAISCLKDTGLYGLYTPFYWPLNSNAPSINQTGIWHVKNASTAQDLVYLGGGLTDTSAIFRAGYPSASYTIYWTLTDSISKCSHTDSVLIGIPAEIDPVWAVDLTVCANTVTYAAGTSSTAQYSDPGQFSHYLPYDSALVTTDTTFFTFFCISCPDTVNFHMNGPTNMVLTVDTPGLYTFGYWLNGLCMEDSTSFTVYFQTGTPTTQAQYMADKPVCDALDIFIFYNSLPDTTLGETSLWELEPGLIALSDTTNIDSVVVMWDGITSLPLTVTYTIFNSDSTSDCTSTRYASLFEPLVPEIHASADTVLLCGISSCNFSYEYRDYPTGPPLTNLSVHFINPQIIAYPLGGSGAIVLAGWTPPYPSLGYFTKWRIKDMNAPGVYSVLISCEDFCGTFYYDTINFTVSGPPEEANSGVNISLCLGNPVVLSGNSPIFGSGHWECTGLPPSHQIYIDMYTNSDFVTFNFVNPNSSTTIVNSHLTYGFNSLNNYYFDWVICNPDCPAPPSLSSDGCYHSLTTAIVLDGSQSSAVAGNDTLICDSVGINIYTAGIQGLVGTWTALPTNPSPIVIWGIHEDNPLVTGFSELGTYGFVWTLLQGCGNLSDTMFVVYDPDGCCFAANNAAYQQWIGNDTINQNFIMSGKYYIDGIITVANNAILDMTNVDLVFATCAGINFESGATIRANNSVLRACNIQDSWRGLEFADSTFGVIENCSFKNAIRAVNFNPGTITVRVFNNTFANNYVGVYAYSTTIMEAISGNTFTIDNSFVDYYKGECALPDTFDYSFFDEPGYLGNYGILSESCSYHGLISQNNFVNGSDPNRNHLFYGIAGKGIYATISNNNFTNMFRSIDIGYGYGLSIFDNEIDISINEEPTVEVLRYATQIRLTQSAFCRINANKINSSILLSNLRLTIFELGALIYLENNSNTEVSDNITNGAISAISLFDCINTFIANNVLKQNYFVGIYAMSSNNTDISCNEIFMDSSLDGYNGYGITINDFELSEQTSKSSIRNNCVFDAITAIAVDGSSCEYELPIVFNNFLYNYSNAGISVSGSGTIGDATNPGRNTLISNNYNNGAVDVENTGICSITIAGNYGINYVSDSIRVENSNPFNSSASCANQITEFSYYQYNQNLEMSELTDCKPYFDISESILKISNGIVELSPLFEQQFENWKANEIVLKSAGLMNVLAANKKVHSIDKVYNIASNSNKLNANDIAWLNYYYNFAKADYQKAFNMLQSIKTETEMEAHTKTYETIISSMLLQKVPPHILDANSIVQLKQLEANNDVISHKAADLLRMVIGGYDYNFASVSISIKPHNKKIKSLAQNEVSIWPNPATDHVIIDYVLQGEQNGELFLFDATGSILLQKTLPSQTAKTSLSINNLSPGIYLLMIKQDGKMVYQTKLIKQ